MKSFLISIFLLACFSLSAQKSDAKLEQRIDHMVKTYKLSSDQAASYKGIMLNKWEETKAMNTSKMNSEVYKQNMVALDKKYEVSILALMSEKQKKIYHMHIAMKNNALKKPAETK